ncbi:MAG: hypothetical protein NVS9B10_29060 [Nevskia sp.]
MPLLDAEVGSLHLEGLDHLSRAADTAPALMGEFIGLTAVILIFGTPVIIVLAVLRHRARRQQLVNEMVLKLADKGQPIPPEVFLEPVKRKSELRSAFSLIGAGLGLMGFFWLAGGEEGIGIGLIPLMIGLGQLASWKIEQGRKDKL